MRFTLLATAASAALAMRPQMSRASVSNTIASIGEIVSKISSPADSLASLREISSKVSVLMEQGPADDHMNDDDRQLLSSVISLIEKTIYSSMDDSHAADVAELAAAIKAAEACNADIALRQSPEGDLGILHASLETKQEELDRLQGIVDDKTEINNTKFEELDSHMQMISEPPACPGLPARTMPALDVYFEKSEYSVWFGAQQASYTVVRDAFVAADEDLEAAVNAYNVQKAVRDVQYCDWKSELEAACADFDACFKEKSDFYTNTLVPRVTADMNSRIEVKKAGDTVVHQINFLLGAAATQETPTIDTSRYEIDFPTLPAKGLCDLTPLLSDAWIPRVNCDPAMEETCHIVKIGSSRSDTKKIGLPYPQMTCSKEPLNEQHEHWTDEFTVTVEDPFVTVKRVDKFNGWGQNLEVECCTFFNTEINWEMIHVGPAWGGEPLNDAKQKVVDLGKSGMQCGNVPVNAQHSSWKDRFHTVVNGDKLLVKRVDNDGKGWGQQLELRCVDGFARNGPQPQMVHVGPSSDNEKTINLVGRGLSSCSATPTNTQHEHWNDEFEVKFDGSHLKVRRTDSSSGWGQICSSSVSREGSGSYVCGCGR